MNYDAQYELFNTHCNYFDVVDHLKEPKDNTILFANDFEEESDS